MEVRPWDPTVLKELEKALSKADLGSQPQNDGKLIRISLPPMNEERRKELVKVVKRIVFEILPERGAAWRRILPEVESFTERQALEFRQLMCVLKPLPAGWRMVDLDTRDVLDICMFDGSARLAAGGSGVGE